VELLIGLLIAFAMACGIGHPPPAPVAADMIRIHVEGQAAADALNVVQWVSR
jgi:hypothetical protein